MTANPTISIKSCPMHMADGWEPPVPAWISKIDANSRLEVLYVGIQKPTSEVLEAFNTIIAALPPPKSELAMFTDRAGYNNFVMIAYFESSSEHVQWEDASGFSKWWESDAHLQADYGLWMERYAFAPGQFETLLSSPDGREGLSSQFPETIGPIREHAYWGGMEDRIPNSAPGKFDPKFDEMPAQKPMQTLGQRIILKGPKNLCLIRSGQDLTSVKAEELAEYNQDIEPHLSAGLKFLADNHGTGCFDSRYMTHCDEKGRAIAKTFGMQVFLSISHLQKWAQFHPTHLAIFDSFQKMAMEREGQFDLRLWHEVAVMDEGDSYAEYVNCDPMTGLLPYAHAL